MRCTKCHYLSFEPEPRCKNCGHDLSLEAEAEFSLAEATLDGFGDSGGTSTAVMAPPRRAATLKTPAPARAAHTADLPLFMRAVPAGLSTSDILAEDDDPADDSEDLTPLVHAPARPRTPVAVRRSTPDPARLRAKYGLSPTPEPDLLSSYVSEPADHVDLREEARAFDDLPLMSGPTMPWPSEPTPERLPAAWQQSVGAATRLMAAAIDAVVLGSIAAVVMYFTLRITGLTMAQAGLLPALPLGVLFVMMVVGYLLMFTVANGQTIGKMAMKIRVVGTSPEAVINDRVTLSQAAMRSLMTLPSVLAFGLGFVPGLLGAGLAVHDRVAHTRVVRL